MSHLSLRATAKRAGQVLLGVVGTPVFWVLYSLFLMMIWAIKQLRRVLRRLVWKIRVWQLALRQLSDIRKKRKPLYWGARVVLIVIVMFVVAGMQFWWWVLRDLPRPHQLLTREQALTTKIYDRHGILLYKLYKNQNRTIVPLESLPDHVVMATLAVEDAEFYRHPGFSIRGISRALRVNMESSRLQGGSTITQQLVKNTLLSPERTLLRKMKEFVLAMEVEYLFTKDEILSMYLNEVGYGGSVYGIEEAANYYFNTSARDLSLAEAALLAGLPASPTTYSPFGSRPNLAIDRQHLVLRRMVEEGMISWDEAQAAQAELLQFASPTNDILAPHFVMFVREWLVSRFGEEMVHQGGLEVVTALDYGLQYKAQKAIVAELDRLAGKEVSNGAALVTRPYSGEILAMVGSRHYFDASVDGQVNVTLRPRQPGSSIKPLTYALAMERGMITAASMVDDSPISYQIPGSPVYAPQNYDGRFRGRVTVRQALASSYNVPAVKVLAHVGVPQLVEFGKQMGITTWNDSSRFGLSLTLGGGEVTMKDMSEVYGVFANGGYRVPLTAVLKVSDYRGEMLYNYSCDGCGERPTITPETAYTISDILSDNAARSAAFGLNSVLKITGFKVAVKTGTTNDLRDNWTVGYTPDFVVATWVGNNDNRPMSRVVSGITGASPIWQAIMQTVLSDYGSREFSVPSTMIKVAVCASMNTLPCASCPVVVEEYFVKGSEPAWPCRDEEPSPELERRDRILEGISDQRRRRRD